MMQLPLVKNRSYNDPNKKPEKNSLFSTYQKAKYFVNDKLMKIKSLT